ncbi:MAG: hypothetical protein JO110_19375 [Acetobacteraceae bacterium]|nr:hypothetical protein [Acetobacteraceae bacterium]
MAFYLVTARAKEDRLGELRERLEAGEFQSMHPFGRALTRSLTGARAKEDGSAVWEEEDYCSPPLAQERAAVLDRYFDNLQVQRTTEGEGWRQISALPLLFPGLRSTAG